LVRVSKEGYFFAPKAFDMSSIALSSHPCQICGQSALREFPRFRDLARVTSDSRPWGAGGRIAVCRECGAVQKLVEPAWLGEIGRIYQSYAIYHQAGGQEQPIFVKNGTPPQPRSRSLIKYLESKARLQTRADVLDFGCGTGSALRTYSEFHPGWTLYGAELSTKSIALLRAIPGFAELFTCPPKDIPIRFDLITLIHALEHVLDPVGILEQLSTRLKREGILFAQVPDGGKTPYDLVIADHLLHFTLETLRLVSHRAGIEIVELTDGVLPKELSLVGRRGARVAPGIGFPDSKPAIERVGSQIDWLYAQIASAIEISGSNPRFGIFGTSISATWLAGILGDRVSFFVDEDPARAGGQHMGRGVLSPARISDHSEVFVPLIPDVAASVVARLSRPTVRFHAPPRFA
jgi:SAM-dependent methyltransferase